MYGQEMTVLLIDAHADLTPRLPRRPRHETYIYTWRSKPCWPGRKVKSILPCYYRDTILTFRGYEPMIESRALQLDHVFLIGVRNLDLLERVCITSQRTVIVGRQEPENMPRKSLVAC
jgi:arginase family enzyme